MLNELEHHFTDNLQTVGAQLIHRVLLSVPEGVGAGPIIKVDDVDGIHTGVDKRPVIVVDAGDFAPEVFAVA